MSQDRKPDFSNVQGGAKSTARMDDKPDSNKPDSSRSGSSRPDFSNVQGGFRTSGQDITPAATERSYTVASGDSLSKIAKNHYGRSNKWRAIYDANRDQLDDPDLIHPGQVLRIPAIDLDGDGDDD